MSIIGDARDLQQVLNSVYAGAVKECRGREHMAQAIVENVKIELLRRGLFVMFEGPPPDDSSSFGELAEKNKAEGGCGCTAGTLICPH